MFDLLRAYVADTVKVTNRFFSGGQFSISRHIESRWYCLKQRSKPRVVVV